MSKEEVRVRGYQDKAGKYRIRIWGKNGKHILFVTSQGYHNKKDAIAAYQSMADGVGSYPQLQAPVEWDE